VELSLLVSVRPMLATAGSPPVGEGWAVEFKWDGVRAIVAAAGERVRISSRNGNDVTAGYPEITTAGLGTGRSVVLDGELVALDPSGRPNFGLLQHRMHLRTPSIEVRERVAVSLYVFDVLALDDQPLLDQPYDVRRDQLLGLGLDELPGVAVPPSFTDLPAAQMLEVAREHGLEGVVAKQRRSRYTPGRRSPAWIKTALLSTQEVVIGGWTAGAGRRAGTVGALLLGVHDRAGGLHYLGNVGTGFTDAALHDLHTRMLPLHQDRSPFVDEVPREQARHAVWMAPRLVGEVVYRTLTADHRLRHAAWRGLRPDRDPDEIVLDLP